MPIPSFSSQARIQEFRQGGGGVQHPKTFDKHKKSKEKRTQRGWEGTSLLILH